MGHHSPPMGHIVLPWLGLVIVPCLPGPSAWPMVRAFKVGLEREPGRALKGLRPCVCRDRVYGIRSFGEAPSFDRKGEVDKVE